MKVDSEIIAHLNEITDTSPFDCWLSLKVIYKGNKTFFLKKGFEILKVLKTGIKNGTIEKDGTNIMWKKAIELQIPEESTEENSFLETVYHNFKETFDEFMYDIFLTLNVFESLSILNDGCSEENWLLSDLLYTDFEKSKFNKIDDPLYDCLTDYAPSSRSNKVLKKAGIAIKS